MGTNTIFFLKNLNLILQTNNIEIQTKKSVLDFSIIIADVIFSVLMMATQESVLMASQDEVDLPTQTVFQPDDPV